MTKLPRAWYRRVLCDQRIQVLPVLLLAFGLRLAFLLGSGLFVDEYHTILAIRMTDRIGYPLLPSGVFYDHGLPYTYIAAGFWAILGPGSIAARFSALLFGVMAVALVYRAGRLWFSDRVGLYAAIILATTSTSIVWSGRARMYTLQQFLFLLAVFGSLEGFRRDIRRYRLVGILAAVMAVAAHHLTLAFLFAFAVSVFLVAAIVPGSWTRLPVAARKLWPEVLVLLIGCGLLLAGRSLWGASGAADSMQADSGSLLDVRHMISFLVTDLWTLFAPSRLIPHLLGGFHPFIVFPDLVLTMFFVTGSLFLVLSMLKRQLQGDQAILSVIWLTFLAGVVGLSLFLLFKADRYVLPLTPLYCLIVGRELDLVQQRLIARRRRPGLRCAVIGFLLAALACLMVPPAVRTATSDPTVLDCAWAYVKENWEEGDAVATCMPTAAYGWLDQADYFAMEIGYVARETEDGLADVWIGAPLVDSPAKMQEALASHGRLWFVVDERAWEWFYSDAFQDVVEAEMRRVSECPDMRVYVSRD